MKWILSLLVVCSAWVNATPSFSIIKQQAQLANAAYAPAEELAAILKADNFELVKHKLLPATQVSYFLTHVNGVQTVAIRGTANVQNVMVDLDVNLKQDTQLGIQVHQGFSSAALAVYHDLQSSIKKDQPIQTTGHSLGGAVALLLGMYLKQEGYQLASIITFGQPKVTNVGGAQQYSNLPLTRVVTTEDIVPLVPPLSPFQLKELDIYWHNGEELILMQGNQYALTSGLKSMMRATKIISVLPDERNLNAHKMTTYLDLINTKLESAKQVPYKTGISLFGLSLD